MKYPDVNPDSKIGAVQSAPPTVASLGRKSKSLASTMVGLALMLALVAPALPQGGNNPPTVRLARLDNGATLLAGTTQIIEAVASDPDGQVVRAEFFSNGVRIGVDTTAPFTYTERSVPVGTFTITAIATDNQGAQTTSAPIILTAVAGNTPAILLPAGYQIERVIGGLTYPVAVAWDDQNRMYVAEAGGQFLEEPPPSRILRVEGGRATEVVNLSNLGVEDSVGGLTFFRGAFYFTHRVADRTGAVSRINLDGSGLTQLFSGIVDSQSEHQVNDIRSGPDGRLYVASGPAFNSAVAGLDNAPFINRSPDVRTTPCRDYVLNGYNFETPDFRTPDQSDTVQTGAFVPFGTQTMPGQRIAGTNKCGGAILAFDPNNAEATLRSFADGFRNVIGFAFNQSGEMFAGVNSYDVRGSRPFNDDAEATYRVRQGTWYGWPDFSATFDPITDPRFDSPDSLKAPVFLNGVLLGKPLVPVIDLAASGLTRPDKSLIAGLHEINSSPSKLDIAPASFGFGGQLFVAEWGDLAPGTTPLRDGFAGFQVTRIDPATGGRQAVPFVRNRQRGPASAQGAFGQGIERPFDVRFGPDGAMYIVDYGIARVNMARAAQNQVPYDFPPQTGAVWRVTRNPAASTNNPPTVILARIANGAVLPAGTSQTIEAAAFDPDGQVVRVEFFSNGVRLSEDITAPFTYTESRVPVGTFVITAVATDNQGGRTLSAPITVTVR